MPGCKIAFPTGRASCWRCGALHKDGRQLSIEFSIQLLKDGGGRIEWVVALFRDVTERYSREKLRVQLKAMESRTAAGQ